MFPPPKIPPAAGLYSQPPHLGGGGHGGGVIPPPVVPSARVGPAPAVNVEPALQKEDSSNLLSAEPLQDVFYPHTSSIANFCHDSR